MSRKKLEQNSLDCSAFAKVFLLANHAGASVFHIRLSNHGISFNINI